MHHSKILEIYIISAAPGPKRCGGASRQIQENEQRQHGGVNRVADRALRGAQFFSKGGYTKYKQCDWTNVQLHHTMQGISHDWNMSEYELQYWVSLSLVWVQVSLSGCTELGYRVFSILSIRDASDFGYRISFSLVRVHIRLYRGADIR